MASKTHPQPADSWRESFAKQLGQYLSSLRERAGVTQRELARRLETNHTWIRRVEMGATHLKTMGDLETYVVALQGNLDEAQELWNSLLEEQFGAEPWERKSVLRETLKRQGEARQSAQSARAFWSGCGLEREIPLAVLAHLLQHDGTAFEAVRTWCRSLQQRHPELGQRQQ